MSEEITSIGIKLDTADIERGAASLDALASKGDKVDAALKKIEGAGASAGKSLATLGQGSSAGLEGVAKASGTAADGVNKLSQAGREAAAAIKAQGDAARSAVSSQDALAAAVASFTKSEKDYVQSLVDEYKQLSQNRSERAAYIAQSRGMSEGAQQVASALGAKIDAYKREHQELGKVTAATGESTTAMLGMIRTGVVGFLGGAVVQGAMEASKAMFNASASAERLRTTLDFSSGGNGAKEIEYLRNVTDRLGLSFDGTAKAYGQFSAAAKGTALEGQKARDIFEAVSKASAVMGLSSEQSSGALLALQQMISKGTVQAEELRGQLGERLPGAFQIAARAMGVTTAELGKMLEQGKVVAEDFLPKFARALEENLGGSAEKAADRLDGAVNRFDNAWKKLIQTAGDSGFSKAHAESLNGLTREITAVSDAMENAKKSGSGMFAELAAGAGVAVARTGFASLNLVANTLNGTINLLTGSALGLRTDLALLPDVLKNNAQQAAIMGGQIQEAQTKLARLQQLDAMPMNGNYYKQAIAATSAYIAKLREAQAAKSGLQNEDPTKAGIVASGRAREQYEAGRAKEMAEAEKGLLDVRMKSVGINKSYLEDLGKWKSAYDNGLVSQKEYADGVSRLATETFKASAAGKAAKDALKGQGSATAGQSEVASIRARVSETQRYIDTLKEQGLEAAKQTEGERLAAKYREELNGGLKGAARANKELALAQAEKLAGLQQESAGIEKSLKLAQQQSDEYAKQIDGIYQSADGTRQQALAQEAANTVFGKGKTAIEEMTLATEKNRLAKLEELGLSSAYTDALKYEIEQQERKVKALQAGDVKNLNFHTDELLRNAREQAGLYEDELKLTGLTALERAKVVAQRQVELKYAKELADLEKKSSPEFKQSAEYADQVRKINEARQIEGSAAVAKVVQDDWAKTAEQINQSLTDALMRGFESGKSFALNLRDTLVNMFKTLVLRPIISATLAPVAGGLSGLANAATGGGGSGGGFMDALGMGSKLSFFNSGWFTNFGATLVGKGASLGADLFSKGYETIGSSLMDVSNNLTKYSDVISGAGDVLGYGGALYNLSQGKYGAAIGGAIGTYFGGPIGAAIGSALGGLLDGDGKPASKTTGDTTARYDAMGNRTGSASAFGLENAGVLQSSDALRKTYGDVARSLGIGAVATTFGTGGNSDGETTHFAIGSSAGGKGYQSADNLEYSDAAYKLEAARAVFSALKGSELPKYLKGAFDDIVASSATQDQITSAITGAQALKQFHEQLQTLPFDNLKDMSFSASKAMIEASGSLDNLQSNIGVAFNSLYSDSERAQIASSNLAQQFAVLGTQMPATSAELRTMILAQDLNTDAGARMAAGLYALVPAFDSVAQAAAASQAKMAGIISNYATDAEVRNFKVEQIRQSLGNAGISLTSDQIANATRQDARALYEQLSAQGNLRGADAVLSNADVFASITSNPYATSNSSSYSGGGGGGGGGGSSGASAADSIKSAWQSITNSMWDEVKRIRGLMEGAGADGFAAAQARLAIATAQARANDQEAAKSLPQLNATMLTLAEANVGTLLELKRIQNSAAGSLSDTASMLSSRYGLSIPAFAAGGYHAGGARIVGENGPELEVTGPARILSAGDTRTALMGGNDSRAADEIVLLRKQVSELSASNEKIRDLLVAVTRDGRAMQSEVAA